MPDLKSAAMMLDADINRPAVLGQAVRLVEHIEGVLREAEEQGTV